MKACRTLIPAAQAIAREADSHELARLLDDAAALLWRTCGEESPLGHLADEARWAAFVLHDRIALHAVGEAGVSERELAIQALTPVDSIFRSPSPQRDLTAALSSCKAAVADMAAGYTRVCARSHPLMAALRHAEQAIEALRAALEKADAPRARTPAAESGPLRATARRGAGTLLLLRQAHGAD